MVTVSLLAALLAQQGPPLTLADALQQAVRARGRPIVLAAQVAVSRAEQRLASQIPNPTFSYTRTQDPPRQHLLADQSFSWLLTRGYDRAAAGARVDRAEADSARGMAELVRDVQIAFFDALAAGEALRLVAEQVTVADSLGLIAQARLTAGDISRLDFDQTLQETRRARQALSEARERARTTVAALVQAIGWTGPTLPEPSDALDLGLGNAIPPPPAADSLPLVRAAVAESLASVLAARGAGRRQVPIPSITGGANWDNPDQPGQSFGVIAFAIPLPFWNQGGGERAAARARADLAAAEAREARLETARVLADSRIRLEESSRRAEFTRDSLIPGARAIRERAVVAYRAGETGVLPVLDALRGEREVVLNGVQDLLAFQVARAQWLALLGRIE